jgi:hypothetical protein
VSLTCPRVFEYFLIFWYSIFQDHSINIPGSHPGISHFFKELQCRSVYKLRNGCLVCSLHWKSFVSRFLLTELFFFQVTIYTDTFNYYSIQSSSLPFLLYICISTHCIMYLPPNFNILFICSILKYTQFSFQILTLMPLPTTNLIKFRISLQFF